MQKIHTVSFGKSARYHAENLRASAQISVSARAENLRNSLEKCKLFVSSTVEQIFQLNSRLVVDTQVWCKLGMVDVVIHCTSGCGYCKCISLQQKTKRLLPKLYSETCELELLHCMGMHQPCLSLPETTCMHCALTTGQRCSRNGYGIASYSVANGDQRHIIPHTRGKTSDVIAAP